MLTTRFAALILITGAALFSPGCQGRGEKATTRDRGAVSCPRCKTIWVQHPEQRGRVLVYRQKGTMVCAECARGAERFFATGQAQHCEKCGTDLTCCEAQ